MSTSFRLRTGGGGRFVRIKISKWLKLKSVTRQEYMQRYERVNAEKIGVLLHQPFADFNANKVTNSLARVELEYLIREIGLIGDSPQLQSEPLDEIEPVHD